VANPQNISWTGPTTYVDGLPYGEADHGGYELELNGSNAVAVPTAWNTSNQYTLPILGLPGLKQGDNTVRMRTVAANGQVSDWTGPVTFPYLSVPKAPVNLAAV
jgi:hypothetical protein